MKRGEVYWAILEPRSGSEQRGRRPVIVASHDGFNEVPAWRSVIIVPIATSAAQARRGPTVVALPQGAAGLPQESLPLCHQVTTLDWGKLREKLGEVSGEQLESVGIALKVAQGLT